MSIKALSAETCSLLGSTTLISSPVSLVKELVDNAIDAHATTISVLVSPNTVDKIEVRDDGHGIDSADFDALGRRGHTSKICCFGDLKDAAGSSLGFRGEGLASANTLGYVAITTRTANKAVASTFRLAPGSGGINSDTHKLVPAPIGTTVAVTCLFLMLPVRRKVVTQEAAKTVVAMKALLCGYAMARPYLRLSLRVMKGAVPGWHYSPVAGPAAGISNTIEKGAMKQAVLLLFGAEVARQCEEIIVSTNEFLGSQATLSQLLGSKPENKTGNYIFEACLPRPDANFTKLKLGGFISIDGRPISIHPQGVAEKILAIFTSSLKRLIGELGAPPASVKGTFMRLNIRCPIGTYDANVDSAKTDVLLTDEKFLCDAFATLCAKTYVVTAQMRYRQNGNALPTTPLRTQPASQFTGNVGGHETLNQSRFQTPKQGFLRDGLGITSNEEHARSLFVRSPFGTSSHYRTESRGDKSSIPDVGGVVRDSMVVSQIPQSQRRDWSNFTPSGRCDPLGTPDPRCLHIQLSPIRKNRHRRSATAHTLQAPSRFRPRAGKGAQGRLEDTELAGVLNDGLRQTTISFSGRNRGPMQDKTDATQETDILAAEDLPTSTHTFRQSFVSARDLHRQKQNTANSSSSTEVDKSLTAAMSKQEKWELGRAAVTVPNTPPPSQVKPSQQRSDHILRVDWRQLRRHSAAYRRNERAWDKGIDALLPDMAEVSSMESQLRVVITAWLSKTKAIRREMGQGALQVELYLRRSLKERAMMQT